MDQLLEMNHNDLAQPLLSIIIATYNSAESLQTCLDSIRAQTYSAIEIIIVDGASSDTTVEVIRRNTDLLERWISEPDDGIYDAWNKALGLVAGDWVYFLGSDDALHCPEAIERAMQRLRHVPAGTLIAYGCVNYVFPDGRIHKLGKVWDDVKGKMYSQMALPHQGVFHANELFVRFGKFDSHLQIAGDYKIIMQSLAVSAPKFLGDIIIADQHAGGKSGLRENRTIALSEFRTVQRELGYPVSVRWAWAYLKGIVWLALANSRRAISMLAVRRTTEKDSF
ncbi:glycosyl transferase family 2 [Loktanella sp. PT4BL]|jgi:glycosyltransferase involved in cell wall biosynthesis|uniref:glycosyltransferase family 2 protein n=1 Tax=Loktanella sp. PT4BL TaxID=2135611 RepID=UPI000D76CCD8|nr:glycosyltransferase family 2 protein [Loktanella sp. PT4BL]PXW66158.1 glycosyl transferase family 2 [Loktanella sp. PT4BL]